MKYKYEHELSLELVELYKKRNCKICLGRGYLLYDKGRNSIRYADYCICVKKNLIKAK